MYYNQEINGGKHHKNGKEFSLSQIYFQAHCERKKTHTLPWTQPEKRPVLGRVHRWTLGWVLVLLDLACHRREVLSRGPIMIPKSWAGLERGSRGRQWLGSPAQDRDEWNQSEKLTVVKENFPTKDIIQLQISLQQESELVKTDKGQGVFMVDSQS